MSLNLPLLKQAVEAIEANPEKWDQNNYCGTAYCLAGHVASICGLSPSLDECRYVNGQPRSVAVERLAMEKLGIPHGQADWLFHHTRKLEDFHQVIETGRVPNQTYKY